MSNGFDFDITAIFTGQVRRADGGLAPVPVFAEVDRRGHARQQRSLVAAALCGSESELQDDPHAYFSSPALRSASSMI